MQRILNALAAILISTTAAVAQKGDYSGVPDNVRAWFKSVRSPRGVPCCDIADGHSTTWRSGPQDAKRSGYEVPIVFDAPQAFISEEDEAAGYQPPTESETVWVPVPLDALVNNPANPNPTGESVVWFVRQGTRDVFIRCFVAGNGG